jgi:hypothetical protein
VPGSLNAHYASTCIALPLSIMLPMHFLLHIHRTRSSGHLSCIQYFRHASCPPSTIYGSSKRAPSARPPFAFKVRGAFLPCFEPKQRQRRRLAKRLLELERRPRCGSKCGTYWRKTSGAAGGPSAHGKGNG